MHFKNVNGYCITLLIDSNNKYFFTIDVHMLKPIRIKNIKYKNCLITTH